MKVCEFERNAINVLKNLNVDAPEASARQLLQAVLNLNPVQLILEANSDLSGESIEILNQLIKRRSQHEPLAYILGRKEFYDHSFFVNQDTLIPRPETELLVDLALELCMNKKIKFVDIGCGCGCIGLSLLAKCPSWRGLLLDIKNSALTVAKKNALAILPNFETINFVQADLFSLPLLPNSMDLIISNPPYVGENDPVDYTTKTYEPHIALFAKDDGYACLFGVSKQAYKILQPGGIILLEHGAAQRELLMKFLSQTGFFVIGDYRDLAQHDRCTAARKI